MPLTATSRSLLIALPLSLALTFILAVVYAFYPLIAMTVAGFSEGTAGTGGVGAVAGGVGESFLWAVLLLEPLLFLLIFTALMRRRAPR
jgi:uncharacterized membrane protein